MHLIFDVSLTVARPWLLQPSGIDRVEFAHLKHWRERLPRKDLTLVMRNAWGQMAVLPDWLSERYLNEVHARIAGGIGDDRGALRFRSGAIMHAQWWGLGRMELMRRLSSRRDSVFLTVSCASLHMRRLLEDLDARGSAIVPLIHDIIPITHPQYMSPKQTRLHKIRIELMCRHADAGLVVSQAALEALRAYAGVRQLTLPPMTVAHPGVDLPMQASPAAANNQDPYFLMIGSLEPRKNHLLMLQIWQELMSSEQAPRLVIVGRLPSVPHTGTLAVTQVDFRGRVQYLGRVNDAALAGLMCNARALLFPSIEEGFGLPLAEALSAGVPAIVSDIPAFREVGGEIPDYVAPLDGPTWKSKVMEYARPQSSARAAQLKRMEAWKAPTWAAHFEIAETVIERTASQSSR